MDRRLSHRALRVRWIGLLLGGALVFGQGEAPVLPQGIVPAPSEPGIGVTLRTDKATYAPGETLTVTFTLSRDAHVYLYNLTSSGVVKLLVPNRFLQEPRFPAGRHTLPTVGWTLRVTEPEGMEYLQLIATDQPLSLYEAKAFEKEAFLLFANPREFAARLQAMLGEGWGTAWTRFRVYRPKAMLAVNTSPTGAAVWVGGSYAGTSPLSTVVAPGRVRVQIEKEGYDAKTVELTVGDGEEVTLAVTLSPARPALWPPAWTGAELPALGVGVAVGVTSVSGAADLWIGRLGLGLSFQPPPPPPDLTAPGPGGWFAWGPEVEGYVAGWLSLGRAGALVLVGLSAQEMAWIPPWAPSGPLAPLVDVEPETRTQLRFTWGLGLGVSGAGWRAYLAWHSRRGFILGFAFGPW